MKNTTYIKICDYIINNPKKSTKNYRLELLSSLNGINEYELDNTISILISENVLKEKKVKWRKLLYDTYIVNIDNLELFLKNIK